LKPPPFFPLSFFIALTKSYPWLKLFSNFPCNQAFFLIPSPFVPVLPPFTFPAFRLWGLKSRPLGYFGSPPHTVFPPMSCPPFLSRPFSAIRESPCLLCSGINFFASLQSRHFHRHNHVLCVPSQISFLRPFFFSAHSSVILRQEKPTDPTLRVRSPLFFTSFPSSVPWRSFSSPPPFLSRCRFSPVSLVKSENWFLPEGPPLVFLQRPPAGLPGLPLFFQFFRRIARSSSGLFFLGV